ncbi:MAG: hypothetical protein HW421_2457 [Ignavibacteria bacterium]|nr:hypothetical protein [Ignavibacteria bacterium]
MKKLLLIGLVLFISSSNMILADNSWWGDICDTSCTESPWDLLNPSFMSIPLPICPGCTIHVAFNIRYNECIGQWQIMIGDFGGGNYCHFCLGLYQQPYTFHYIYQQLLKKIQPVLDLGDNDCIDEMQLSEVSCLKLDTIENGPLMQGPYVHYIHCTTNSCCKYTYRICKVHGVVQEPELLYTESGEVECDTTLGCFNRCPQQEPRWNKLNYEKNNSNELKNDKNYISFIPNPSDGNFTIKFNTGQKGDYILEITDIEGKGILKESFRLNGGIEEKQLKLAQFHNGNYLFKLVYHNETIQTGKFGITK